MKICVYSATARKFCERKLAAVDIFERVLHISNNIPRPRPGVLGPVESRQQGQTSRRQNVPRVSSHDLESSPG
jgi:hypothetical protein